MGIVLIKCQDTNPISPSLVWMHLFECYRLLGLPRNASLDDIKIAYRRLARKYHPDINKEDPTAADKFRLVQEAYQLLKDADGSAASTSTTRPAETKVRTRTTYHSSSAASSNNSSSSPNAASHKQAQSPPRSTPPQPPPESKKSVKERRAQWFAKSAQRKYRKTSAASSSNSSNIDPQLQLKLDTLRRLQDLLKQKKYVVAIAVAEGMREKFPTSLEVIHWQAVAYHRWGSDLLMKGDFKKAELYLNKALTTDPRNRELCFEVKRDLERIERHQGHA
jgi:tetratricopeptide (TPR) repeat protein